MNVTKIILTRCQIFHLKCTKFNFGGDHSTPPELIAVFAEGREKRGSKGGEGREREREVGGRMIPGP